MPQAIENQAETRSLLLKYLKAAPGEKPLTEPEYKQIAPLLDVKRGGLTREAYDLFKDKELVKAAHDHQVNRLRGRVPEGREPLLRLLRSQPDEKVLSFQDYRKVLPLVDLRKGGINSRAYEIFREDKEITEAAAQHRKAVAGITRESPGKGPNASRETDREPTDKERDEVIGRVRGKRPKQASAAKAVGMGIGD